MSLPALVRRHRLGYKQCRWTTGGHLGLREASQTMEGAPVAPVGHYLRRLFSTPPLVTARKTALVLYRRWQARRQRQHDRHQPSYLADADYLPGPLHRFLKPLPGELLQPHASLVAELCRHYLDHRFDLLGSGWVRVEPGMNCRGLEGNRYPPARVEPPVERINAANRAEAERIRRLITPPYRLIDWQIDFKSGYRWNEGDWYQDIAYGHAQGADIKVPWELARMQHLPWLAQAYGLARSGCSGLAAATCYAGEFRNQVLDFSAGNPPRFGVNWRCPMDVAIRAVNWLVARDLFVASELAFDREFEHLFSRSIQEHGRFILANLEWNPRLRTNHYLANVAGLLFIAAYLPASPGTDRWLRFAVRELVREVGLQFLPDGGSFEASTSYHRLAAEMVLYGTALVLGLAAHGRKARVRLPSWYPERLQRMTEFTRSLIRPDGMVPEIGDNDSGRFLKLEMSHERLSVAAARTRYWNLQDYTALPTDVNYLVERPLDHASLLAGFSCLFEPQEKPVSAQTAVLQALSAGNPLAVRARRSVSRRVASRRVYPGGSEQAETLTFRAAEDFGLFCYRSAWLHLVLRCGPVGQHGQGGHAHNDQLSFELAIGGRALIVDPGSYLYTPVPAQRNRFRSTGMHNTLVFPGLEQNGWRGGQRGLFSLTERSQARLIAARPDLWVGEHQGFGRPCRRTVRVLPRQLDVQDWCPRSGPRYVALHLAPAVRLVSVAESRVQLRLGPARVRLQAVTRDASWKASPSLYSAGYGWLERNLRLELHSTRAQLDWQLQVEDGT